MKPFALSVFIGVTFVRSVGAQDGSVTGRVRESWGRGVGIGGARVEVVGTSITVSTDYKGRFSIHVLPSGRHRLRVVAAGYTPAQQDSLPVYAATRTAQDFFLPHDSMAVAPRVPDPVIDPDARDARRRFTDHDLAALPVTDVAEAIGTWPGIERLSFRAGRPGAQALVIDGIPVHRVYGATRTPLGLRVPVLLLREVALSGDAWSENVAALASSVALVTREGGSSWEGGFAYTTDRAMARSGDLGFDRILAHAGGPIGRARILAVVDATGRLQADAHGLASGDAGTPPPWLLPHNSGERLDLAGTLSLPLGSKDVLKVFGVHSRERREMFDPAFKYATQPGAGRAIDATMVSVHLERLTSTSSAALRVSYFERTLFDGQLTIAPEPRFGALGGRYDFRALDIAKNQELSTAAAALPGVVAPEFSFDTPWGVTAFFFNRDSRGDLQWTDYEEVRVQASLTRGGLGRARFAGDGTVSFANAKGFQRVMGYLPVGDSIPPATALDASPTSASVGGHLDMTALGRTELSGGVRVEAARAGVDAAGDVNVTVSPHVRLLAPIGNGSLWLAAFGVTQPQDLDYLTDVALSDSIAGGRFRQGNAALPPLTIATVELGVGAPLGSDSKARLVAFRRRFTGLVRSTLGVPADSSRFTNDARATVTGAQLLVEGHLGRHGRWTVSYALESGDFASEHGYRQSSVVGEARTLHRFAVTTIASLPGGVKGSGVAQYSSGVPFPTTRSGAASAQFTLDGRLRRAWRLGPRQAWVTLEVRNLLNRQNLSGPGLDGPAVDALGQAAFAAAPDPIPYDSPRYRPEADLDQNGLVEGAAELLPLFQAAARDIAQPLLLAGPPRMIRLGVAIEW